MQFHCLRGNEIESLLGAGSVGLAINYEAIKSPITVKKCELSRQNGQCTSYNVMYCQLKTG